MKYYDPANHRLIFEGSPATAEYWDKQWRNQGDIEKLLQTGGADHITRNITPRFLEPSPSTRVVDAGCGKGQHVASLKDMGYDAYGVDYAPETVQAINSIRPDLKVKVGDVLNMPYDDQYFDGYWSFGVIEHFWQGYDQVLQEINRVLRPGGYAFMVFPHLSLLRRFKAHSGMYDKYHEPSFDTNNFYQFALNDKVVAAHFANHNFKLRMKKTNNGIKGLKEEVTPFKPTLQKIYDSKFFPVQVLKVAISRVTEPVSNHTIIMVFQKQV